jgi:hypothetical protein
MKITRDQALEIARQIGATVAAERGETIDPTRQSNNVSLRFVMILAGAFDSLGALADEGVHLIKAAAAEAGSLAESYTHDGQARFAITYLTGGVTDDTSNPDGTPTDHAAQMAAIKDANNRITEFTEKLKKPWPPEIKADLEAKLKTAQDDLAKASAASVSTTATAAPFPDTRTKAEVLADTKADNAREAAITADEKKAKA